MLAKHTGKRRLHLKVVVQKICALPQVPVQAIGTKKKRPYRLWMSYPTMNGDAASRDYPARKEK